MPRKSKGRKTSKPAKSRGLIYADESNAQRYAKITKSQGGKPPKFEVELLNEQKRIASLPSGVARTVGRRVVVDDWILIQPLSGDIDGLQEIVVVYSKKEHNRLEKEGRLAIVKEVKEEESGLVIGDIDEGPDDRVIDDDEIDIDDL